MRILQALRRLGAQHREIGIGISADEARAKSLAVALRKADRLRAIDDVIVREHEPVGRYDDAAARSLSDATAARAPNLDVHDRRRHRVDDVDDGPAVGIHQARVIDAAVGLTAARFDE